MSVEKSTRENGSKGVSPFDSISRSDWAELAASMESPLTEDEIARIQGLGDVLDIQEVKDVYLPLSRLLNMYVREMQSLHESSNKFLGHATKRVPFVI
jgi:type I pantothenate kinase